MGLLTFLGGIHPYEGKELSMEKPVREYLPKGDCVYPLSQHIGAPATPIVKKGLCGNTKPVFCERIGILILSTFLCVLWYFLIPKSKYRKFQPQCPKGL